LQQQGTLFFGSKDSNATFETAKANRDFELLRGGKIQQVCGEFLIGYTRTKRGLAAGGSMLTFS
jgi:hypothetical protein